jgi:hypothetical protein
MMELCAQDRMMAAAQITLGGSHPTLVFDRFGESQANDRDGKD